MNAHNWKSMTPIFLIGVGVGAAIGILFAAKSGQASLNDISEAAGDVSDAVRDGVDGIVKQGRRVSRQAQRTLENAREHIRDAAEAGEQVFREVKNRVS